MQTNNSNRNGDLYQKALQSFQKGGNSYETLEYFHDYLSLEPEQNHARVNYAMALERVGRIEESLYQLQLATSTIESDSSSSSWFIKSRLGLSYCNVALLLAIREKYTRTWVDKPKQEIEFQENQVRWYFNSIFQSFKYQNKQDNFADADATISYLTEKITTNKSDWYSHLTLGLLTIIKSLQEATSSKSSQQQQQPFGMINNDLQNLLNKFQELFGSMKLIQQKLIEPNVAIPNSNDSDLKKNQMNSYFAWLPHDMDVNSLLQTKSSSSSAVIMKKTIVILCYTRVSASWYEPSLYNDVFDNRVSLCQEYGQTFTASLYSLVKNQVDFYIHYNKASKPTGFIFHESRCGSSLFSNMLSSIGSSSLISYMEPRAPTLPIFECLINHKCSLQTMKILMKHIVQLMVPKDSTKVLIKFQSLVTPYIDQVTELFPNTNWIFIYRDPVEVLMSHLSRKTNGKAVTSCLRHKDRPHSSIKQLLNLKYKSSSSVISDDDFCAATLGYYCNKAVESLQNNRNGIALHYREIKKLAPKIFDHHFDLILNQNMQDLIQTESQYYSKRGENSKKKFEDDSLEKQKKATSHVKKAAALFLTSSYDLLQALSKFTNERFSSYQLRETAEQDNFFLNKDLPDTNSQEDYDELEAEILKEIIETGYKNVQVIEDEQENEDNIMGEMKDIAQTKTNSIITPKDCEEEQTAIYHLQELIDTNEFWEKTFEKTFFHIPSSCNLDSILTLEELLSEKKYGKFKYKTQLEFLENAFYKKLSLKENTIITPTKIKKTLEKNQTIVFYNVQKWLPAARDIGQTLTELIGRRVNANMYMVYPHVNVGVDVHNDQHCVFVMQLQGKKRWRLYSRQEVLLPLHDVSKSVGTQPQNSIDSHQLGTPDLDVILNKGDILYIPRGMLHLTSTNLQYEKNEIEEPSIHLTYAIAMDMFSKQWVMGTKDAPGIEQHYYFKQYFEEAARKLSENHLSERETVNFGDSAWPETLRTSYYKIIDEMIDNTNFIPTIKNRVDEIFDMTKYQLY